MLREIEGFRLSPQQRRLRAMQQTGRACNAQCVIGLEGSLDIEILKKALNLVILRHEALRTSFHSFPGTGAAIQTVREDLPPLEINLHPISDPNGKTSIEELIERERNEPFDLEQSPLLRASLFALSANKYALALTLPSLCADARSLDNLIDEVRLSYAACREGRAFSDEVVQYSQFSEWQNELLEDEDGQAGRQYWREQQAAFASGLSLPYERAQAKNAELEPLSLMTTIDLSLARDIDTLASSRDTTAEAFLLACWQTLVWRITQRPNITVGYMADGRKYPELQQGIGLFAKFIPAQSSFQPGVPFVEALQKTDQAIRDGSVWQEYFIWEEAAEAKNAGNVPFFPIMFSYEHHTADLATSGVYFTRRARHSCIERFKIHLCCSRKSDAIETVFYYDGSLFDTKAVDYIARLFGAIVKSALDNPQRPVDQLKILSPTDEHQLLAAFNSSEQDYERNTCAHELFEEQVKRAPDRIAVVFGDEQLTYTALNARANQLAYFLRERGVTAGTLVGLAVERSLEMISGLLGILKSGGAYVPLDAEHPKARLASQFAQTQVRILITQEKLLSKLPPFDGELICIDNSSELRAEGRSDNAQPVATPEHPCYTICTSGSTGVPKSVVLRHQSLTNYSQFISRKLGLEHNQLNQPLQFATVSTLSADLGNTSIFPALISGGCLHVVSYNVATDSQLFAAYITERFIDVLKIVPSHISGLMALSERGAILPRKYLILGGEALSFDLAARISQAAGGCQLINHYGPTETTVGSLTYNWTGTDSYCGIASTVPIGRPAANTQTYVVDQHFEPVPIGVSGELLIGGDGVAEGYLNRPDQTAEKFLPDPFSNQAGKRLYRTGDLARYLPDGNVEFLGRVDHQVKIRGFRIELGEIEYALTLHESVREALAVAREDGSGSKRLVAYLILDPERAATISGLRSFLKNSLPEYMMPSAFVTLRNWPLTSNGKIDRDALPAPDQARPMLEQDYAPARTPVEQALAGIWSRVLGIEQVGIHDNFFQLGGDSILSLQIIARAREAGLRITPKQIFQHRTIAELAVAASAVGPLANNTMPVTGDVALTPIQRWFFEQDVPDPHHWNFPLLLEFEQRLDPSSLSKAAQYLFEHHDALRLRFVRDSSGWKQYYIPYDGGAAFSAKDLSGTESSDREAVIESTATELQASLDLSQGPLARLVLFDMGTGNSCRLLLLIHHLIADGVSLRILIEDLLTAYSQLIRGEEIRLQPKTTSFKQWAARLVEEAHKPATIKDSAYWLQHEARARSLPADYAGGANTVEHARSAQVALNVEETNALLREVPKAYNTRINDVLLTAALQAFSKWTGERALRLTLEGHGREEIVEDADLSRTIGWFTTQFPVMLDLGRASTEAEALKSVKEQLRCVPGNGISYGLLRYLNSDDAIASRLRAIDEPQVKFNYFGQMDQPASLAGPYKIATERIGPSRSPRGKRTHLLEINASIASGQLQVEWTFSEKLHSATTIERLAQDFLVSLRALIIHCQSAEGRDYTPSDFPQAEISQEILDRLVSKIRHSGAGDMR